MVQNRQRPAGLPPASQRNTDAAVQAALKQPANTYPSGRRTDDGAVVFGGHYQPANQPTDWNGWHDVAVNPRIPPQNTGRQSLPQNTQRNTGRRQGGGRRRGGGRRGGGRRGGGRRRG